MRLYYMLCVHYSRFGILNGKRFSWQEFWPHMTSQKTRMWIWHHFGGKEIKVYGRTEQSLRGEIRVCGGKSQGMVPHLKQTIYTTGYFTGHYHWQKSSSFHIHSKGFQFQYLCNNQSLPSKWNFNRQKCQSLAKHIV